VKLAATPQWQTVALHLPQDAVEVRLVDGTRAVDVTGHNVVAALKPFSVAIGRGLVPDTLIDEAGAPELQFVDRRFGCLMGALSLRREEGPRAAGHGHAVFEVWRGENHCARLGERIWDAGVYRWTNWRKRNQPGFSMTTRAIEQSMVFYICPRPVYLVSVDDGERSNIFPMDLVGPLGPDEFSLALRNTSPSVETIKLARRVVMSGIAADDQKIAYQLGAHHRKLQIDTSDLPFKLARSKQLSLPVPEIALYAQEVEILNWRSIGSHTLFIGRIVAHEDFAQRPQLFHTCGIYQKWRSRAGVAFPLPGTGS
jgi:flavin reductase (DIM6/NTAB) family NADH-FMN oxidoreductase RutF